jgi:hypothetical protein
MAATAYVEFPAKCRDEYVPVLIDLVDYERLGKRTLSIGSHGYAQMWDGKVCLFHRWAVGVLDRGRRVMVDHKDRNILDCRRQNLRVVDPSTSNVNRQPSDSRYAGTERMRNRWQARPQWRGQRYYLGTFETRDQAAEVVQQWRAEHPQTRSPRLAVAR